LNDDSSEVRIAAARALLAAGAPGPGFSALHEALESSELATQAKALQALNDAGPLPENVRRTLAELREQGHTTLREAAAKLLALQEGA
jgi:hypothetical protein